MEEKAEARSIDNIGVRPLLDLILVYLVVNPPIPLPNSGVDSMKRP